MPNPYPRESAEPREDRKRITLLEQENEVLRRAAAYLSQANPLYPLVNELAADGRPATSPDVDPSKSLWTARPG